LISTEPIASGQKNQTEIQQLQGILHAHSIFLIFSCNSDPRYPYMPQSERMLQDEQTMLCCSFTACYSAISPSRFSWSCGIMLSDCHL